MQKGGRLVLSISLAFALLAVLPASTFALADAKQVVSDDDSNDLIDDEVSKRVGKEKAKMVNFLTKKVGKLTASPELSSSESGTDSLSAPFGTSSVVWESPDDFFVYGGAPQAIPSESTMAIDPFNRDKIVGGFNDDSTGVFNARIVRSNDMGTSWIDEGTWGAAGEFTFNQIVLSDTDGKFYYVAAALGGTTDIRYRLSLDDGNSWSAPVIIASSSMGFNDKPWAAVDTGSNSAFTDNLYICWTDFGASTMDVDKIQFRRAAPSLGPAVTLDSVAGARIGNFIQGCYVSVDQDGKVYVAWMEMTGRETGAIRIRFSTDGGSTFGSTFTVATFDRFTICDSANGCVDGDDADTIEDDIRVDSFPRVATDNQGGVHVVYAEKNAGSGGDVMYAHAESCIPGNCDFSNPIPVPPSNGADQWHPSISILEQAAGHTVQVLARDRSETGSAAWKIMNYFCEEADGVSDCESEGAWSVEPISLFTHTNLGSFYTGDYDQITSPFPSSRVFAIWTDTAEGDYNVKFDRTVLDGGGELQYDIDLFEGSETSDRVVNVGQEVSARVETNDESVAEVTILWINPAGEVAQSKVLNLEQGAAGDVFVPDETGEWRVEADFGNGRLALAKVDVTFFVLPESPIGALALAASSLTSLAGFLYFRNRGKSAIN